MYMHVYIMEWLKYMYNTLARLNAFTVLVKREYKYIYEPVSKEKGVSPYVCVCVCASISFPLCVSLGLVNNSILP